MKSIFLILCWVLGLGFFSTFVYLLPAEACVPVDDGMTRCERPRLVRPPVAAANVVKSPATVPTANPKRGTSPYDAMEPNDTWQTLGANATAWFRIGEEALDRVHLDVWLDVYGKGGINFAVYSPEQFGDLSPATPPKGRGTANKNDKTHDLNWSGQAPAGGTWYVLVSNSNSSALTYKLGYNRVVTGPKDCSGPYWEWIGAHVNSMALWPGYCP